MADWIKMRSSLLTNPRVTRMARLLLKDQEFTSWMYSGRDVTRDEAVTKRDVPVVTRIVIGGLLPVWAMVNDTAARDGVVRHASSQEIDDAAGIPGFFRALETVEWAEELPHEEGVRFVNFDEHNSPQKERSLTSKSGAERTKEYRERKKREAESAQQRDATCDAPRDVTVTSQRDDREEESRGEKRDTSSSLRSEENGASKSRPSRAKREEITLKAYLQQCREQGVKAVPEDHPVRAYCRDLGASEEMVQVAWCVFRDDYTTGKGKDKRYKDWPTHFHNAIRKGWVKVWYAAGDGQLEWSQVGLQARLVLDERQRAKEGAA
jgi:hypothetical protein